MRERFWGWIARYCAHPPVFAALFEHAHRRALPPVTNSRGQLLRAEYGIFGRWGRIVYYAQPQEARTGVRVLVLRGQCGERAHGIPHVRIPGRSHWASPKSMRLIDWAGSPGCWTLELALRWRGYA